jgi:hypothetical protein
LEVVADEMDGTPQQSALILFEILEKAIADAIADYFILTVNDYGDLTPYMAEEIGFKND